ncbi:MAG: hypothetical protein DWQ01_09280 [Planctomycetota bacterium]|nr:MAG: hypothetical protein DWQ01_09280 [Planctomycetota bacterium]
MDDRNLIAVAEQAAATSRVLRGPLVGATVKADDGRVFLGCRLEYEDPSLDQDALSNAIAAGRVEGMRKVVRAGFYMPSSGDSEEPAALPPLETAALHRLKEMAVPETVIILSAGTGAFVEKPLSELLAEAGV